MKFEYFIAGRYLKSHERQAFISLVTIFSTLGIAVGVMALIVVISVMTGFESELKNRILGIESHILVMRYGDPATDYQPVVKKISTIEGVASVEPFIYTQVMLRSPSGVSGAVLRGQPPDRDGRFYPVVGAGPPAEKPAAPITTKSDAPYPNIIVGKVLAEKLKVEKGDVLFMISPVQAGSGKQRMPLIKRFQIDGFFETGMNEYDGVMVYMMLEDAQKALNMEGKTTGVQVRVDDIYKADIIAEKIIETVGFPFWARDWMQMNRNLFSMLKLQKVVMFIILALIILVAAFNIASSLIMMVMEKTKDVAILKAMGTTPARIRKIFVLKGLAMGVVGTVTGGCMGFIICGILKKYPFIKLPGDVYFLTTLPVNLQLMDAVIISVSTLFICFFATLYPAMIASRLDPVEGIRIG